MNFLELHNAVLDRLRENRIVSTDLGSDPYVNSISAHINDAKDAVENAWTWNVLRGEDDIVGTQGAEVVTIPSSGDINYLWESVLLVEKGVYLNVKSTDWMSDKYASDSFDPVGENVPQYAAPYYADASGDLQFRLYPRPDAAYTYKVFRSRHQDALVAYDDVIKVPSLPVYTLAHALASRERGEVGGTPSSELFGIAQSHLSDAIALDAALRPQSTDWFVSEVNYEQNNRYRY